MTEETFFEKLKQTPRDWQLRSFNPRPPGKLIRRGFPWQCPISSLSNKSVSCYWEVAIELGLGPELASRIISAADADGCGMGYDQKLRNRILAAVGLPEEL